ncbi:MAG: hypothetical protein NTU47_10925 [Ignavibacteriales bacterium]|nr:hypothetical protein [Ignavibacteriales bacterium]
MKKLLLIAMLILIGEGILYSQQAVVYVNERYGDDLVGDGKSQVNPYKTIRMALHKVADRGTIILLAGDYDYGDIVIDRDAAPYVKSQLTLMAQKQGNNQIVNVASDSLRIDIDELKLNVETVNGTECFNVAGTLVLGSAKSSVKVNIPKSSFLRLKSKESLIMNGKSAFTNAKPEMGKK